MGGLLVYDFWKNDPSDSSQTYEISGSNQEGFGLSALSQSSASIVSTSGGEIKISATGEFYDRATLIGKSEIEILLKVMGPSGAQVLSFEHLKVNGAVHTLGGRSFCEFWESGI
jgi:hypothetical protein